MSTRYANVRDRLGERGLLPEMMRICAERHVPLHLVISDDRSRTTVRARWECWQALRKLKFSYPEIGTIFEVNPTTVLHGCATLEKEGGGL